MSAIPLVSLPVAKLVAFALVIQGRRKRRGERTADLLTPVVRVLLGFETSLAAKEFANIDTVLCTVLAFTVQVLFVLGKASWGDSMAFGICNPKLTLLL